MDSSVLWMPEDQVLSDLEARPSMMVLQIEIMMILVAWTLFRVTWNRHREVGQSVHW